jgi:hypothetical protein
MKSAAGSRNLGRNLVRALLSLGTLALLLYTVGWREVLAQLREADLRLLALAWLLFMVGIAVRACRWQALLHGLGVRPGWGRLFHLYLVGGFFNTFLPTGFGGDVVRVLELGEGEAREAAAGTELVDRVTVILSLLALGLLVLPFSPGLDPRLVWVVILVAAGGLMGGFLLLEGRLLRRLTGWLPARLSLAGEGVPGRIYAAVTGSGLPAVLRALALSTLFNLLNVAVHWLCGLAVGIPVGLSFYFVAVPLLSLSLLAPISVGGLGVRDWVAQPLFASVGVASERAAGMTLSAYAVTAAAGLVGGALYLGEALRGMARGEGTVQK